MNGAWWELVAATAAAFTALVFARAALHKLGDFSSFTGFVADYRLVPERLVRPVSWGLVGAELAVVAAAVIPVLRPAGLVVAIGLYGLYAVAIAVNVVRGRDRVECGCGGAAQPLGWALVVRNLGLAGIAALGFGGTGSLDIVGAIVALLAGVTLFAGYLLVEQIMANAAQMRLGRRRIVGGI